MDPWESDGSQPGDEWEDELLAEFEDAAPQKEEEEEEILAHPLALPSWSCTAPEGGHPLCFALK